MPCARAWRRRRRPAPRARDRSARRRAGPARREGAPSADPLRRSAAGYQALGAMTGDADSTSYGAEQVAGLLGLTLAQLRGYVRAGVIEPERGERGVLRFSFQDLVFLRVVKGLATSRVPPRRVTLALRRLR